MTCECGRASRGCGSLLPAVQTQRLSRSKAQGLLQALSAKPARRSKPACQEGKTGMPSRRVYRSADKAVRDASPGWMGWGRHGLALLLCPLRSRDPTPYPPCSPLILAVGRPGWPLGSSLPRVPAGTQEGSPPARFPLASTQRHFDVKQTPGGTPLRRTWEPGRSPGGRGHARPSTPVSPRPRTACGGSPSAAGAGAR